VETGRKVWLVVRVNGQHCHLVALYIYGLSVWLTVIYGMYNIVMMYCTDFVWQIMILSCIVNY